ncbi:hypothetical protein KNT64_gp096 [Pseudomonas phage PspYZU05]|uniref:Transglycosylase SLT domain-containing protein n=1 Tax=Pseudomonas phage PspYZU05 TaxID=1983556 RepID=A0A2U7NLU2_9CAUD|nr:hypothetical protein KNT64_gp096 [Pseudomonas phage PspYZU05]ASD52048.1 hypothetical protein PspYZU05_96 [Pseudomonas phage PspYZU05]
MKKICLLLLISSLLSPAYSKEHFSDVQKDNLHYAYAYGEQFTKDGKQKNHLTNDKKGLGFIMAAIAWQESSAGINTVGKKGHKAYGMFQNYLPTVKARYKQIGINLPDQFIVNMLNGPRENSATWAYIELSYWLDIHKGNMRKALSSYNAGWNIKAGSKYAQDVLEKAYYLKNNWE